MILLDEARWPAHGRLWGHLVPDTDLNELHRFAARVGVPARGFDLGDNARRAVGRRAVGDGDRRAVGGEAARDGGADRWEWF